jgi:hypothetical protein
MKATVVSDSSTRATLSGEQLEGRLEELLHQERFAPPAHFVAAASVGDASLNARAELDPDASQRGGIEAPVPLLRLKPAGVLSGRSTQDAETRYRPSHPRDEGPAGPPLQAPIRCPSEGSLTATVSGARAQARRDPHFSQLPCVARLAHRLGLRISRP